MAMKTVIFACHLLSFVIFLQTCVWIKIVPHQPKALPHVTAIDQHH